MTKIAQNRNFQHTTLSRHVGLPDHKLAVEAPLLRENMKHCQSKNETKYDKAVKVLLKCVHWISYENLPLSKFKSLIDLLHDLDLADIAVLKKNSMNYDSEYCK